MCGARQWVADPESEWAEVDRIKSVPVDGAGTSYLCETRYYTDTVLWLSRLTINTERSRCMTRS